MLSLSLPRKSVVRLTNCLDMAIADDWDVKPQTKRKNTIVYHMASCLGLI